MSEIAVNNSYKQARLGFIAGARKGLRLRRSP